MFTKLTVILLWLALFLVCVLHFAQGSFNDYEQVLGEEIEGYAVVATNPSVTSSENQSFVIKPHGMKSGLRVGLFNHAYVKKGDLIWFKGVVTAPENFGNFNYTAYLKMLGAHAELKRAKILVIDSSPSTFQTFLLDIRSWAISRIQSTYDSDKSGLILGMLIGSEEGLSENLQESYRKVGLSHILVVSGYNLTILASAVGIFSWLVGRRLADFFGLIIIWIFVVLVGASGGVVRAGIMASLLILARLFGRLQQSSVVLLWAVVIMALINPARIFYDIGLQLSVAATYGVITATRMRIGSESTNVVTESLWSTLGAIIFTAPLVAYYFGTASLSAPLVNLILLPFIPIMMLLGALSLSFLGVVVSPVLDLLLTFQISVVKYFAEIEWLNKEWNPSLEFVISSYVLLILAEMGLLAYRNRDLKKSPSSDKISKIII